MHDLVYEIAINSVAKSVTLKEDMCHTSPRFSAPIPGGVVDFSLFHELNLSDPNPQTADIKSGYRGRESRTSVIHYRIQVADVNFKVVE